MQAAGCSVQNDEVLQMRIMTIVTMALWGSAAAAHPGHLAGVAGHDHWVAGAAIGLAILAGIYGVIKGQKKPEPEPEAEEAEEVAA